MNALIQSLDPSLTNALGWTIIHSFWQASLIALLMSLLHRYSNQKNATFRYGISVVSMILVFAVSAITFGIYYTSSSVATEGLANLEIGQINLGERTEPSGTMSWQVICAQNIDTINLIWITGVLFFMFRFILSYAFTKYLRHSAIFTNVHLLEQSLARIKNSLLINKTIEIAESAKIKSPVLLGHFKPIILFPLGIVNMLSTEEVDAIIMHEIAHIKRNDYLTNIFLTIIEIFFYFHPAVWWISANVKAERENCCDDFALSKNINKVVYANALVKLEEIKSKGIPSLAIPFSSKKHQLINRIKRIMNMPQTQTDFKEKSIATILLLSMVLLFNIKANGEPLHDKISNDFQEMTDSLRIEGNDEMILKIKDGKFESLTVDNKIMNGESIKEVASTINSNAKDRKTYTVTIKQRPKLTLSDNNVHISGGGGITYESEDANDISKILADTIPAMENRSSSSISRKNGKTIEVDRDNGVITKLKIDGKLIPKNDYDKYKEEIDASENAFEFDNEDKENFFRKLDNEDFSKSFGLLFDGEHWREFGGNMNQLFDEDILHRLKDMEGLRLDFKGLEGLKELEILRELKGLERLKELEGLGNLEELKKLENIFEDMGITLDTTLNGMNFQFHNFDGLNDFEFFKDFKFDDDGMNIFRDDQVFSRNGTVVERISEMLNKDGLLREYKSNKIEITGKHLKINGEKMPNALFEKYKNIYQESTGAPLTKNSKMVFDVEGKPSKRKVKTF
jgi:beta-lactamase regulating signal transducer with metallopeptidase domain